MLFVHKAVERLEVVLIPALIKVPTGNVGDIAETDFIVNLIAVVGHRTQTVGVFPLQSFLQMPGKRQGILVETVEPLFLHPILQLDDSLVHIPPHNDGRMVVMLANHFAQGACGIRTELVTQSYQIYYRNLLPYQHAEFVASTQHGIVLWVMCQTDKVHTHVFQQLHIPAVHLIRKRYAHRHLVLMTASSHKFQGFPIQLEAFLRIHAEPADPQRDTCLIFQHLATHIFQRNFHAVQIRGIGRPQLWLFQL